MPQFPARVISDGRITIPEDLRDEYDIDEGDLLDVEVSKYNDGPDDGWI